MGRDYADGYLTCIERQSDGWPTGITKDEKEEAIKAAKDLLDKFPQGVTLRFAYQRFSSLRLKAFHNACLWDYLFAVTNRALEAVTGCETVWRISPEQRSAEAAVKKEEAKVISWYRGLHKTDSEDNSNGRASWYYTNDLLSAFPSLFGGCYSNYDARDMLREAGVLRKNNNEDTESCQFWIYFTTEKAGENFIDRFNKWAEKRRRTLAA